MRLKKDIDINKRFFFAISICALFVIIIIIRLFTISLANFWADKFDAENIKKIVKYSSNFKIQEPIEIERGLILDKNLSPLANSIKTISLSLRPDFMPLEHREIIADSIATILNYSQQEKKALIEKIFSGKKFIWLKRRISQDEFKNIENSITKFFNKGVSKIEEYKRIYPSGEYFSNIIGFTGIDNNGLEGIELAFNKYLYNTDEYKIFKTPIGVLTDKEKIIDSFNLPKIILTIDKNIQTFVYDELSAVCKKFDAKRAMGLVLNPKNGDILAMVRFPSFDNNNFQFYEDKKNWLITDMYEPGSTLKIITVASLIESKNIDLSKKIYDKSYITIFNHTYHNSEEIEHGWIDIKEAFVKSSNVGIIEFSKNLSSKTFYNFLRDFGLGIQTGIELPGEEKGKLLKPNKWSGLSKYSIAIGQEIAVTPIQLIMALSVIPNNGILLQPHIIKEIRDNNDNIILKKNITSIRQVISKATADILKDFMIEVVKSGTGKKAYIENVKVAGKTGTAQKAVAGRYEKGKYYASFFGFFPADNPEYSMLIIVDEPSPKYGIYGGDIAAPAFKNIALKILEYQQNIENKYIVEKIKFNKINKKKLIKSDEINYSTLIDLTGYSFREAVKYLTLINKKFTVNGHGYVKKQIPAPGINLNKVNNVILFLGE
ncbi:MAG TPA: penicillin-binding transpeptidase domain-containing protein [bacterium]|nr:penicillin-binding transpeptidase domain-containing protein [bacterium]HOL46595.1 penicillin-binding transpeptidase domain-containing protein [bacterium]HPQ17834.1 penicillin-binding transpeptidase domain-containing protein [bacterium]